MSALSADRLVDYEAFALELAAAAAQVALPLFRGGAPAEDKNAGGHFDPVTEADRGAEAAMRRLIGARFPEHGVVGEEYGEDRPNAEFVWVLDPVDGTRAFVAGLPSWTTLIGLRGSGQPIVGAISQPCLREVFVGSPRGSRLVRPDRPDTPIRVRPSPKLSDAVIATTDPDLFDAAELAAWTKLRAAARLTRLGWDAYGYAVVALGHIDLIAESGLKAWDWTALIPVIEGAGGVVTNWRGGPVGESGQIAAAGDRACLEEALAVLRRAAR